MAIYLYRVSGTQGNDGATMQPFTVCVEGYSKRSAEGEARHLQHCAGFKFVNVLECELMREEMPN